MTNQTISLYEQQKEKTLKILKQLSLFIEKGKEFGLAPDPKLLTKIDTAISESTNDGKLKIALIGGFSEGKTSIAAAWLGRLDESMKISQAESSNEVKVYEVDNKVQLIDTPGLFGFKEQSNDDGEIEKYKDLTKRYVSEAHLVLYVVNSSNPIKESHREDLNLLFRELNLLPRTVFVLSKFDDVADIEDNDDYSSMLKTKKENVSERLKQILDLNKEEIDNLKIVGVSANPFGEGTQYWLKHLEEFKQISHIDSLQQATTDIIEKYDSIQDIIFDSEKSMLIDVLSKQLPKVRQNQQILDEELNNLTEVAEQLDNALKPIEQDIKTARMDLIEAIQNYLSSLISQVGHTDLMTFPDFFEREIGKDGVIIETKLERIFFESTQHTESSIEGMQLKLDAELDGLKNKLGTSDILMSQGLSFLKNTKVNSSHILAARDATVSVAKWLGADIAKYLKFKPWGAENLATKVNGALAVVGIAMEAYDSYKKMEAEEKLLETKNEIKENLENQRAGLLGNLRDEKYIEKLFPSYTTLLKQLADIKNAYSDTENRKKRFEQWANEGEIIEAEFSEIR
ncbi:LeoA/HP0731 family dynamin-like GTPase [Avibacterium paragallinarum]|uniref:50S ribosome-binding GTPase n=2 Tax=Avibacterium paragallinarum TaxID=728 RepID=A0AAE5WG89_AVIPA|nr:LeoA/HP0731 family dynamin-like GTPase [Avibacterium paragallinarum]MEE3608681.1 LeoA/HP0731 family dynamin-like GTPase [Avibacterium paragallinarum]MEE3621897.1 LeoA/HP0731 family dynamin-like GTPase [Avibacterium paragallinarum]MEE3668899.1 LeoA/HP0731 family dynamin-like GTPase [Avibacterium paragallinarum]MEE3680469.1 LeoA/HP0731 family dynamin-like GTPase [Avibacterium paragallinarum]MEE4385714.1 LeoA/HP0731 family dynamin-like GTPase [Avibacterium paragallinarum]